MELVLPRDAVRDAVKSLPMKPSVVMPHNSGASAARLRDRHHTIARMVAMKVPDEKICKVMGMTQNTLDLLRDQTPAFITLVQHYTDRAPANTALIADYMDMIERNMIAAEVEISDRLQSEPEKLSISELHKIARDGADRLGFSKHSVNLNVNITLAERLEGLRRRSKGAPAGAGDDGGPSIANSSSQSGPPLLELKANSSTLAEAPIGSNPRVVSQPHHLGSLSGVDGSKAEAADHTHPSAPRATSPQTLDPDAPMSREEVLAKHRAALHSRETYVRPRPPPVTEKMRRL